MNEEKPMVLSEARLSELTRGARVPFDKGVIESAVFDVIPGQRKLIALTVYDVQGKPLGICDFLYAADAKGVGIATLESPITTKRPDLSLPAIGLRREAGDDGMYVIRDNRKSGTGKILFTTALEVAKKLGAKQFVVKQAARAMDWYTKLGAKTVSHGVALFDLR